MYKNVYMHNIYKIMQSGNIEKPSSVSIETLTFIVFVAVFFLFFFLTKL